MMNNPKVAVTFRILVACYLIYLGGRNLLNPGEVGRSPLIVISSILFIGFGAGYALFAYKAFKNISEGAGDANVSPTEESEDANVLSSEGAEDVNASPVEETKEI